MSHFDIGIRCDYFVPMSESKIPWQRDIFLGIKGSKITKISPWSKEFEVQSQKFINAKNQVVMPGLINGHTHLAMTLFKGLGDDLSFHEWLNNYILPLERKCLTAEFVRIGTELAVLESLRFGVTTVCDMYYFEDVVCDVLDKAGMRGVLAGAISDFPNPDNPSGLGDKFKILKLMVEKYKGHERIVPGIGPHSPYGCGDETLTQVRDFADKHNIPTVMHLAETKGEVEGSLKQYKMTPAERIEKLGLINNPCIFAHCVHLSDSDIDILAQKKASVIYNPESNMKLGAGVAPIPKILKRGIPTGIGTDGSASNNDLSLFREMDSATKIQKLHGENTTAMTAIESLTMATSGGAKALGLGDKIGKLKEGMEADITIINLNHPHMRPVHNLVSQLVYSTSGLEVDTVLCRGKVLVENQRSLVLDETRIYEEVEQIAKIMQGHLN